MLDPTIVTLLDDQFGKELFSAYLYLSMANYYEEASLNGFANWFFVQAQEERDHAMLIRTYLLDNNAKMKMGAIKNPEGDFKDFLDPLKASLEHEQYVTRSIHEIYAAAYQAKDFRTMQFLDWFVKEQGEEEKTVEDLIQRFELFGRDPKGLYSLDQELGARTYVQATLQA
ncbi:ferritin [Merdimmobilis hominis]|uniref:Ferritin n=1 Tax=uncultured Anaerotruncus sp. TaxID=905011 RepID=A0A6N2S087_9FIRM|nr:ferritin [Merdimmobilis hominis]MCD4836442.1 ferritin [Merdimmobilis hominis]PWL59272.1 MAG: ferritin [Oscillospiraceae bacterium]